MNIGLRVQRLVDGIEDDVEFGHDITVPEPHHSESELCEPGITFPVRLGISVLDSIDFDDVPLRVADKVDDIPVDRFLSTELPAEVVSQTRPEQEFGFGHLLSEHASNPGRP